MTSAAVAFTFYVDLNPNSDCPDGYSFCMTRPQDGYCCPSDMVLRGVTSSGYTSSKVVAGFVVQDGAGNQATLFNADGSARSNKGFTTEEIQIINNASMETGTASNIGLGRKEYDNTGSITYIVLGDGDEITETGQQPRSPSCERVHMNLYTCNTYTYNSNGGGTTCTGKQKIGEIYYKKDAGYFTNPNYSSSSRLKDENMTSGTTLSVPTRSGYTFRGYFTSVWTDAVGGSSSLTDSSSYINNLNPYRTIGNAYIPWKENLVNGNTSGNELFLRAPNWVVSGPGVSCPSAGYQIDLYAGWAENCEDSAYCKMTITGKNGKDMNHMVMATNNTSITGQWLPGAVEYERVQTCKTGTPIGTEYVTKKYGSQSLTFALGTSGLGCEDKGGNGAGASQITINYYDASGNKKGYTSCNIGETVTLNGATTLTDVTAFKFKGAASGGTTFNRGETYSCNVTRVFTQYTTSGDNYIVNLEPATTGGNGGGSDGKINVTINLGGGEIDGEGSVSGKYDEGASVSVEKLGEITRGDGAIATGLKGAGESSSDARNTVTVSDKGGGSAEYEVVWSCPDGMVMNPQGVCVDPDGDYIDRGGNSVPPSQLTCWRDENGDGIHDTNYCYWHVNITFHGKPAGSSLNVTDPNEGKTLDCYGGQGCHTTSTDRFCASYLAAPAAPNTCATMHMPTATGYKFRGYYRTPLPTDIITQTSTTNGGAYNNFFPKSTATNATTMSITGHAIVVMSDTPVATNASINIDVYGGWARACDTSDPNAICDLKQGIWWNTHDNLGKGDVRYDTGCADGYVLRSGGGTYKPICETEKGGDGNLAYVFKDQWGNTVSCNGPAANCTLGDTFSLTNTYAVQQACGSNYKLKYLITTGESGDWWKPGKSGMSCSTNLLGSGNPRTIIGTVCNNFCTIGQHYDDLHGTCVGLANQGDTPNSLGVTMPRITNYQGTSYWVVNGSDMVQDLWGTCANNSCTADCPTLQCDDGYGLVVDSTGPHCVVKTGGGDAPSYTCPSLSELGINLPGVTVKVTKSGADACTYTLSCSGDHMTLVGNSSVTCYGSNGTHGCTNAWVSSQIGSSQCKFQCPSPAGSAAHTSVSRAHTYGEGTSGKKCDYKVVCSTDCPASNGWQMTYDGILFGFGGYATSGDDWTPVTVSCEGNDCYNNMPGTNMINPNMNGVMFSKFACLQRPSFTKCPAVRWLNMTNLANVTIGNPALSGTTCSYDMGCSSGTLTGSGSDPLTCTGDACTVKAINNRLTTTNYSCSASSFTCPTSGWNMPTGVGFNAPTQSGQTCTYKAKCTNGGTLTGGNGTITCTGTSGCTMAYLTAQFGAYSCPTGSTAQCPTTGWNMQTGVGFNGPSLLGSTCTYTPKCTNGGTLYNGDAVSNGATITCTLGGTGSAACTTDNLGTMFRPYYCPVSVTCPSVGTFGNLANGTIAAPTKPNVSTCRYQLSCNTNYTLNGYNPIECSGDTCNTNYLSSQLQQRSCQSNSISCPSKPTITNGTVTTNHTSTQCKYTLDCNDGYAEIGTPLTYTCTSSQCTQQNVNSWASELRCQIQCPTNGLSSWSNHGSVNYSVTSDNSCKYEFGCDSGYSLSPSSPTAVTCTGTSGSNGCTSSWLTSKLASYSCQQNFTCPSKADVSGMLPDHMLISEPTLLSGNKCKYTLSCQSGGYTLNPSSPNTVTCTGSQCTDGGVAALVEGTYTCNFTCPEVSSLPQPNNATLTFIRQDGNSCDYRQTCDFGYKLSNGNSVALPECSGSECFSNNYAYFTNFYNQHQCAVACPNASEFHSNLMVGITNMNITNTVNCKYAVQCESSDYALFYNGVALQSTPVTKSCDRTDDECEYYLFNDYTCKPRCPDVIQSNYYPVTATNISSQSNATYCAYDLSCNDYHLSVVEQPQPMMVPRTGSTTNIENTGKNMLSAYTCAE